MSVKNPAKIRFIQLEGVRQNNIKNISVEFPLGKMSVITGLSGSGKSSLAFETLYAEGQRRYVESLSTYTRQFLEKMSKPEVDSIKNIPPSIALEQHNHVVNSRSTVGTQTEIHDHLRILFSKIGETHCTECGEKAQKLDVASIAALILSLSKGERIAIAAALRFTRPKKVKGSKLTPKTAIKGLYHILKEQGYRRVAYRKTSKICVLIDFDNPESEKIFCDLDPDDFESQKIFLIVDRLKLDEKNIDPETRTRLTETVESALKLGNGKLSIINLTSAESGTYAREFTNRYACLKCGKEYSEPEPSLFSFNSPLGACENCKGFGYTLDYDESLIVPEPHRTLKNGAFDPFTKPSFAEWQQDLFRFSERHGISVGKKYSDLKQSEKTLLWEGDPNDKTFAGILGCFEDLERYRYKLHVRVFIRRYQSQTLCPECEGTRINKAARLVKIENQSISDILALSIEDSEKWINTVPLKPSHMKIAKDVFDQVRRRLSILNEVGVGYLTLSRLTKSLSGGEFQRINLATQLGGGLCGTLYVLDEPSIGLHAIDTEKLISVLTKLRDQGNTLVIVEHDLEVMRAADWLVELGPGAGYKGGELIAAGTPKVISDAKGSITGKYLRGDFSIPIARARRPETKKTIKITRCEEHNLKNINIEIPLERFVVVTGVSGSGKTTLVHKTLYMALERIVSNPFNRSTVLQKESPGKFGQIYGAENVAGVVLLDQKPIGKSSRSNPATYLKGWDEIRRVYSNQVISLRRGYTPQYFSFNVDGGRCPICKGEGEITLDMHFLAEIKVPCDECKGQRFRKEILDVKYRGKNVFNLLKMTIDEAYDMFRDNLVLARKFSILRDVGLGYLQVGQSASTLSGGESQRLKIAGILEERTARNLLYIFDEPTTGLHQEDVKKLLYVVQDLIDRRNSVVMIEHHLDLIAQADWVIDLGPGGGKLGGEVVAEGPPNQIILNQASATGAALRKAGFIFPERDGRPNLFGYD